MIHAQTVATPGRQVGFSVQRLADGLLYDHPTNAFSPTPATPVKAITEDAAPYLGSFSGSVADAQSASWSDGPYRIRFHDTTTGAVFDSYFVQVKDGDDLSPCPSGGDSGPALPALVNGGFELPALPVNGYSTSPPDGWTFAGFGRLAANGSNFTVNNPVAPEGVQVVVLQQTGAAQQAVPAWPAGTYIVAFQAARRSFSPANKHDFAVKVDADTVATITTTSTSYGLVLTPPFEVAAGDHVLAFVGLNTSGGDNSSFIDDVRIFRVG